MVTLSKELELTIDIKFEQLVEFISQLPENMKTKLIESVNNKVKIKNSYSKDEFQKLKFRAPARKDEEMDLQFNI